MRSSILLATVLAPGCLTSNSSLDPQDLAAGGLAIEIEHFVQRPGEFTLDISKNPRPALNAAQRSDCVALQPSLVVTGNQLAPVSASLSGGFDDGDAFEKNCIDPSIVFVFASAPVTVGFVLDDGTATVHVDLAAQSDGTYAITRCDVASCTMLRPGDLPGRAVGAGGRALPRRLEPGPVPFGLR
jgi:hypothetical protein